MAERRPLPDKGKLVARQGRKATDQAPGLSAELPKEGLRNFLGSRVLRHNKETHDALQ